MTICMCLWKKRFVFDITKSLLYRLDSLAGAILTDTSNYPICYARSELISDIPLERYKNTWEITGSPVDAINNKVIRQRARIG